MNSLLKNYFILYVLQQGLWGLKFNFNIFNAERCFNIFIGNKKSHNYCFFQSTFPFCRIGV